MTTLILFDIDGTLLSCGGAGRRAMESAFEACFGRRDVFDFSFAGQTDLSIARRGLENAALDASRGTVDQLLNAYTARLRSELSTTGVRVLQGVEALLAELSDLRRSRRMQMGLGTGNLEVGARVKLQAASLWERFDFGGFGCDHEDRAHILGAATRRGAARAGVSPSACRVVVVGDTPRDVQAAREIGATSVAVATGSFTSAELREAGASATVQDLTDPEVLHLIAAETPPSS